MRKKDKRQRDQEWLVKTCNKILKGRSRRQVAPAELDVSATAMGKWMSGEVTTDNLSLRSFRAIAGAMGMTPSELMLDYEEYVEGYGDEGSSKSTLSQMRNTLTKLLGDLTDLEMTNTPPPPKPTNDNAAQVRRLSAFLQALMLDYGLDWRSGKDRRTFAESSGRLRSSECPWDPSDLIEPDGSLYRAIAGTLPRVASSLLGGLAVSCKALTQKEIGPDDLVRLCNGADDRSAWLRSEKDSRCGNC